MKQQHLVLVAVILAAISLGILVTERMQDVKPTLKQAPELLSLAQKSTIESLTITHGTTKIALHRTKDNYWLGDGQPNYLGNTVKVAQILDSLNQAKVQREFADTKDLRTEFGLDDATQLDIGFAGKTTTYFIGKTRSGSGQYVSVPTLSSSLWFIDLSIPIALDWKDWQDMRILTNGPQEIVSMRIEPLPNSGKSPVDLAYDTVLKKFFIPDLKPEEKPKLNEAAFKVAGDIFTAIAISDSVLRTPEWDERFKTTPTEKLTITLVNKTVIHVEFLKETVGDANTFYTKVDWDDSQRTDSPTKIGAYISPFLYKTLFQTWDQIAKGREEFLSATP